jgi:hypothetical protein
MISNDDTVRRILHGNREAQDAYSKMATACMTAVISGDPEWRIHSSHHAHRALTEADALFLGIMDRVCPRPDPFYKAIMRLTDEQLSSDKVWVYDELSESFVEKGLPH